MQDKEQEKELLKQVDTAGENARVLAMTERGATLGWAAVEIEDKVLRILKLSAGEYDFTLPPGGEENFILDTLVRSAASYGEALGANFIETAFPDFHRFFAVRGFSVGDTNVSAPMSVIVKYE